jgi:hypothetical protein
LLGNYKAKSNALFAEIPILMPAYDTDAIEGQEKLISSIEIMVGKINFLKYGMIAPYARVIALALIIFV